MEIRPNASIASLAGTARAQAHGPDGQRGPSGGGVAENPHLHDNALGRGAEVQDRDADGRQMLEHRQPDTSPEDDPPGPEEPSAEGSPSSRPPSLDPSQGQTIDFDA